MGKDFYFILGISKDANEKEIKKAYRKIALKVHPDRNGGNPIYEEIFKEVKEAYETLIDKNKRANYDLNLFHENQKYKQYNNLPPEEIVKKIIVEVKKIVIITEDKATPTINSVQINNFLEGILLSNNASLYKFVSIKQKKEFIFYTIPLFRYISELQRSKYFDVFSDIIGKDEVLLNYVKNRIDEVVQSQKKIDKKYHLNKKMTAFMATSWGRVIVAALLLLFYYLFINLLDYTGNHDSYSSQESIISKDFQNKKIKSAKISKWRGNQLKTGTSPYDKYLGKGVYERNFNKILFQNNQKLDVVVFLVKNGKTIRNKYIRSGDFYLMTDIPNGDYHINIFYGKYWNPHLKLGGKLLGGFDTLPEFNMSYYSYSFLNKSDENPATELDVTIPEYQKEASQFSLFYPVDADYFFDSQ